MKISTALWPLQQAIIQRWQNDIALEEKVTAVLDHVDSEQLYPYVTIGEPIVTPGESKSSYWEEIPWTHHVWSQYNGKKEGYDILGLMLKALTSQPLSLEGGFVVTKIKVEQLRVYTDIDNRTYHGIVRVRYYIQK